MKKKTLQTMYACTKCDAQLMKSTTLAGDPFIEGKSSYSLHSSTLYTCETCSRVYGVSSAWSWTIPKNNGSTEVKITTKNLILISAPEEDSEEDAEQGAISKQHPEGTTLRTKNHLSLIQGGKGLIVPPANHDIYDTDDDTPTNILDSDNN